MAIHYIVPRLLLAALVLASSGASKLLHRHPHLSKRQSGGDLTGTYPTQNFTMPLDHFQNDQRYAPHTNRTFQQHYWMDDTYYKPGGPIIVNTMGEDGTFDLTWFQAGLLQELANATCGLAVLWGQRYYAGNYNIVPQPFTTESLRFHTTEQAMADLAYFAQHATFRGHEGENLTAESTPWIVIGGSYAGVISAFTRIQYPNVFWGGLSSSGITVALNDNWQYYDVVHRYGPQDCVANQQKFINIADNILVSGNSSLIKQLKSAFSAVPLTSDHDFANILSYPLSDAWSGNAEWIPSYFANISGPNSYCGNITSKALLEPTNATVKAAASHLISAGGWGNESSTLLNPFLNFISTIRDSWFLNFCPSPLTLNQCFSPVDVSPFNWIVCMEYGQFATGYTPGTKGHPPYLPLGSRLLNVSYAIDSCRKTFNLSSSYTGPELNRYNKYGGFNMSYPRLALSTGEWDPLRTVGPLALEIAYGVPNPRLQGQESKDSPETVIKHGGHEWDLQGVKKSAETKNVPPEQVVDVKGTEVDTVMKWLEEWKQAHS